MDQESAKNIGGVGALLVVIAGVAIFGTPFMGLLGLAVLILVLIALKGMADSYKEAGIFNNALYSTVIAIVGGVAFIGVLVTSVLQFLSNLPDWAKAPLQARDWQGFANAVQQHASDLGSLWTLVGSLIIAFVILFAFLVVAMLFSRRSLRLLSTKTNVGLFGTTALIMLIGAMLTIVLIGFILIWIGFILLAIAFFQVRAAAQPPQTCPTIPPSPK
jgi:uncharacterized membrane protein